MADVLVAPQTNAGRQRLLGKVFVRVTFSNRGDEVLVSRGMASPDTVRSVDVEQVLVDTGATSMCLPLRIIERLGLPLAREVEVETATGIAVARLYDDLVVNVEGRRGVFECLELPGGNQPLFGVVPLQALGLNLDLANGRMDLLPDRGRDTYLSIL